MEKEIKLDIFFDLYYIHLSMSLLLENVTLNGLVQGSALLWRTPVRVATTAAGTLASSFENGDTVDGVVLVTNDRILIKNQASPTENGIYIVQATGAPVRADDYQTGDSAGSTTIPVRAGTVNGASIYMCTNTGLQVIGTDPLTFSRSDVAGGTLDVARGGTGLSTLTSGRFLVGNGTSAVDLTKVAPSGVVVGTTDSQTLTNKTLSTGTVIDSTTLTLSGANNATFSLTALTAPRTYTFPDSSDTLATQTYVDNAIQGLDVKRSVRVATTVAGTLATSFENGDTVDGVVLATNDRILIKNQATASENGIYIVQASGAPVRADDADNSPVGEVTSGMFTFVEAGTANAGTGWVLTTSNPITLGVTNLAFGQFSSAGFITAGNGLSQTGNQFDVNVTANGGIVISSDNLQLDLAASAISGTLGTFNGGTGLGGATPFTASRFVTSSSTSALEVASKAVPTGVVVGDSDSQTLTNKTLTSPIINQILDSNGAVSIAFNPVASAINYVTLTNADTGNRPVLASAGSNTNIDLGFAAKGTGVFNFAGSAGTDATLRLREAGNTNYVDIKPPTLSANYSLTLPVDDGLVGQVLQTDGSGVLSWKSNNNVLIIPLFHGTAVTTNTATNVTTSGFTWQQSRYGTGGTYPLSTSAQFVYSYTSTAADRDLTVAVYNLTTSANLGAETIPAASILATGTRTVAFTPPTADAYIVLRIRKSASSGSVHTVRSAHMEFTAA